MIVRPTIHFRTFQARAQELGFPSLQAAILSLYQQQQQSLAKVGGMLGCSGTTIRRYLQRYNMPIGARGGKRINHRYLVIYQGQVSTIRALSERLGISPQWLRWKLHRKELPGARLIYQKKEAQPA